MRVHFFLQDDAAVDLFDRIFGLFGAVGVEKDADDALPVERDGDILIDILFRFLRRLTDGKPLHRDGSLAVRPALRPAVVAVIFKRIFRARMRFAHDLDHPRAAVPDRDLFDMADPEFARHGKQHDKRRRRDKQQYADRHKTADDAPLRTDRCGSSALVLHL